jgi:hypothetical protein
MPTRTRPAKFSSLDFFFRSVKTFSRLYSRKNFFLLKRFDFGSIFNDFYDVLGSNHEAHGTDWTLLASLSQTTDEFRRATLEARNFHCEETFRAFPPTDSENF